MPIYENETVVGAKHAAERGLCIGDTIQLGSADRVSAYLITGLSQGTDYLGDEAYLTRQGYERIQDLDEVAYYIELAASARGAAREAEVDAFIADIEAKLGSIRSIDANQIEWTRSITDVYISALRVIVWALAGLTVLIRVLVMVLLTRTALNTKVREHGILKAVGYTTKDLMAQILLSFLPPLAGAECLGLLPWSGSINSIVLLFMRSLGTMRCSFVVPGGLVTALGIGLLAFALGVTALMALRIRSVSPADLMAEE